MPPSDTRFPEDWNIAEGDFVMLFLSQINYKKGLNLILPAMGELVKTYPNLKLIMAGDYQVDYMDKVKGWITAYALQDHVVLPGFLSGGDKAMVFRQADCFLLPSLNENFGIAVIEALAYGLPVVITRNVYIYEAIEEKGGWVCDYSVDSLKQVLAKLINNQKEVERMAALAPDTAKIYSLKGLKALYQGFHRPWLRGQP